MWKWEVFNCSYTFLKSFRYTCDVQMACCSEAILEGLVSQWQCLQFWVCWRILVNAVDFYPRLKQRRITSADSRIWLEAMCPGLAQLFAWTNIPPLCEGSCRRLSDVLQNRRDKRYIQLRSGCSNSAEAGEGSLYFHWCKWKQKHLPCNLKHCTAAWCNFLTLHFADIIYKPGLCLF